MTKDYCLELYEQCSDIQLGLSLRKFRLIVKKVRRDAIKEERRKIKKILELHFTGIGKHCNIINNNGGYDWDSFWSGGIEELEDYYKKELVKK